MSTFRPDPRLALLVLLASVPVPAARVTAQFVEPYDPDPAAVRAFGELLEAYRGRPALEVTSTLKIELVRGEHAADSSAVTAEIAWSRGGGGIVKIRDFVCTFRDGTFSAIHAGTDHSYFQSSFEGSPYWVLLNVFQDLPYPHLALFWGEPAADETWMQIAPATPWIVPTAVTDVVVDDQPMRRIVLSSPHGSLEILVDPKRRLARSMRHEVTGGPMVEAGTTRRTTYAFQYVEHDAPLPDERLTFAPGERQRVDMLASLLPPPAPADGGPAAGAPSLVGQPAPAFTLATMRGGAVDLEDLRGRVVVLDFWATWCGPCRAALPLLHEVAAWARAEELPVTVLTVNVFEGFDPDHDAPDVRRAAAEAFWAKHRFSLPVAMDYTDETAAAYGVRGIPATFIVRSDGVVHAQHTGLADGYVDLLKGEITDALDALEAPAEDGGS